MYERIEHKNMNVMTGCIVAPRSSAWLVEGLCGRGSISAASVDIKIAPIELRDSETLEGNGGDAYRCQWAQSDP